MTYITLMFCGPEFSHVSPPFCRGVWEIQFGSAEEEKEMVS